jgi:hypothetical protein
MKPDLGAQPKIRGRAAMGVLAMAALKRSSWPLISELFGVEALT